MSDTAVRKISKPLMRGMLRNQIKRNLIASFVACAAGMLAWQVMVKDANKKQYNEFYKNYDIEKEFETMRKKGVFDSCSKDD